MASKKAGNYSVNSDEIDLEALRITPKTVLAQRVATQDNVRFK